jgi:hypothetical protein
MALTHALAGRRIKYQASLGFKHRPFVCSCAPTSPPLHHLLATMAESYVLGPPALENFPFGIWARLTPVTSWRSWHCPLLTAPAVLLRRWQAGISARDCGRLGAGWWQNGGRPAHKRQSGATRPAQHTQSGLRLSHPGAAFLDKPLTTGPLPGREGANGHGRIISRPLRRASGIQKKLCAETETSGSNHTPSLATFVLSTLAASRKAPFYIPAQNSVTSRSLDTACGCCVPHNARSTTRPVSEYAPVAFQAFLVFCARDA